MVNNQISLPENIYKMYNLFEKSNDILWKDNPFKNFKSIGDVNIKMARNLSNLNYYIVDIPFNNQINPNFLIQYIKNIDYRNYFSSDSISFKVIKEINKNNWIEEEKYCGFKNLFNVITFKFQILFYNPSDNLDTNISQAKYYNCYKIFKNNDKYILRLELVLNNLDIDHNFFNDIVLCRYQEHR